jgi:hypothetical protein
MRSGFFYRGPLPPLPPKQDDPPTRGSVRRLHLRRDFPGQKVMLELLARGDRLRFEQQILAGMLKGMLTTGDPGYEYEECRLDKNEDLCAMQKAWAEFTVCGGITADDLDHFIKGEPFGTAAAAVNKRHLRLVSNRRPWGGSVKRLRLEDDPPEAA